MYDREQLHQLAEQHGFQARGKRAWLRRTSDLIQLINLQASQWSRDDEYLNFAFWPLAFGEPPTIAESKFPFRARAEDLGAESLEAFFSIIENRLKSTDQLHVAVAADEVSGLISRQFRDLLAV